MTAAEPKLPQCPHCGETFCGLKDGRVQTHDFPRPCRSVCPGSRQHPKQHDDTPLWKDDPQQRQRDFIEQAGMELRLYGFAVVKEVASYRGGGSGNMPCPLCGQNLKYSVAPSNGHCAARCTRELCINAME